MYSNSKQGEKWIERLIKRLIKRCENNSILVDSVGEWTHSIIQKSKLVGTECTALNVHEFNPSLSGRYDVIVNGDIREFIPEKRYGITFLSDTLHHMEMDEAIKVYEKLLAESEFLIMTLPISRQTVKNSEKRDWTHKDVISTFNNLAHHYIENGMGVYVAVNPTLHSCDEVMEADRPLIAVYGIYKNEEKFIERFLNSIKDADEIVLCDTGSTDRTNSIIAKFQESNLNVSVYRICVSPWRFDDARNTTLSLISSDIDLCISLDIDEYLMDGWKEHLISNWEYKYTRYFHKFSTIWPDGRASQHWHERIHIRMGYTWKLPVHEILEFNGEELIKRLEDFWIYQEPDVDKSKFNYLPLLEQSVRERRDVWKSWSFLADEYLKQKKYGEALKAVDTALSIENSDKGYLHQLKYLIYKAQKNVDLALVSLNNAVFFMPDSREIRFEKAKYLYQLGRSVEAFLTIKEAERIKTKFTDYHYNQSAWNEEFDKWKLKLREHAIKEGLDI